MTVNFTELTYQDELDDRNSVEFNKLGKDIAAAVESLYDVVGGYQTVVVISFR